MPPSHSAVLALKWPGRCSVCGKTLAAGERAQWDASPRRITCLECVAAIAAGKRVEVDAGTPGASAQREYQRRRAARELRARQRLGLLGVGLAKISGDPWSTRAWRKGAEGEARVARRLVRALDGKGVHLLHDRLLPGRLCFVSTEGLPLLRRLEVDGVLIDRPGRVAALAARAGSLTPEQTLRLHMQLASSLRPA